MIRTKMTKICSRCKIEKTLSEFGKDKKTKDGLNYWCKECCKVYRVDNKERKYTYDKQYRMDNQKKLSIWSKEYYQNYRKEYLLQKSYGITLMDFNQMLINQNNICPICKKEFSDKRDNQNRKDICVDHNHETGQVRELLHIKCNTDLHDIEWHKNAITYLERYNNVQIFI